MDQEGETPVFRSDAIRRASVNPYDGKDEEQSATTINTTNVAQLRSAGAETRYRLRIVGGTQALAVELVPGNTDL